uniref:THH1/TOM1/TOM3 domain-containing protein n=1 Tax=Peronospora matthiolae TaxID=2874970 RepID=A0AAV1VLI2_9STRA
MPLFLANLAMSSYFLALCYVLVTAMTVNKYLEVRRVLRRHEHTTWSTVQLLVLSVALGSFFRSATFSTLCILDSQAAADLPTGISSNNPWVHDAPPLTSGREDANGASLDTTGSHAQAELDFYNKVVAVLFNLPDFLFVSSYLLLVLVWAETFQSSRRHWFSAAAFRRKWMIFYLVFNGGLYLTQLVLYASLFLYDKSGIFDDDKEDRLSVIPETIFYLVAAADLFLPIIIFSTWVYLTLSLSGFPMKSQSAELRLQWVGRLVMAWSVGRILYSVMTLLTFTKGWFNVHHEDASAQAMLLVVVFFAAELIPIYLTLDKRLLAMLSVENYEPLLADSGIYG